MIIDAHLHLWKKQQGMVNGKPVYDIGGGKSDFGGIVKQMMPPYMTDGVNSVERLIANMDFAQVNADCHIVVSNSVGLHFLIFIGPCVSDEVFLNLFISLPD